MAARRVGGSQDVPESVLNERQVPETYEAEAYYDVQLWRPAELYGRRLIPAEKIELLGSAATLIQDSIFRATKTS